MWKVRASQSYGCPHTIQTQPPARLAAGHAILVASWLVFSCAAASLQEVAGSLFLQHLLGCWDSQAWRRNCWSGSVSSVGGASSQDFVGRKGTRSKLQMWLAGLLGAENLCLPFWGSTGCLRCSLCNAALFADVEISGLEACP